MGLMGCVQSRELGVCAPLAFRGLSCWEASVTLYLLVVSILDNFSLWLPFAAAFAVLKGLNIRRFKKPCFNGM